MSSWKRCSNRYAIVNQVVSHMQLMRRALECEVLWKKGYENNFKEEQDYDAQGLRNPAALHELIQKRVHHSCRFHYLTYAEDIKRAREVLKQAFDKARNAGDSMYLSDTAERAYSLLATLDRIYTAVVTSALYEQQRIEKPLFDREEKRLDAALYAQRAAADEARYKEERILLNERTRAKEIQQKIDSIACTLKQCQVREQEIKLEHEKVEQKKHIQEAVAASENRWTNTCNGYKKQVESAKTEVRALHDALEVPPLVSEEYQSRLKNYLSLLRRHCDAAQVALCR